MPGHTVQGVGQFCCDRTIDLLYLVCNLSEVVDGPPEYPGTRQRDRGKKREWGSAEFEQLNFYQVLEVSEDVGSEELKKAYRQKALEHHPDKNLGDSDGAKLRFARVKEAYETLVDDNLRRDYNYTRAHPPPTPQNPYGTPQPTQRSPQPQTNPSNTYSPFSVLSWLSTCLSSASYLTFGRGLQLPNPIARLMPSRYMFQYPPPFGATSVSIENIVEFVNTFPQVPPGNLDHFFTIFEGLFECLAFDELQATKHTVFPRTELPKFGDQYSSWCWNDQRYRMNGLWGEEKFVEAFYNFWTKFETKKDFGWLVCHNIRPEDLVYPQYRAIAEMHNQAGRSHYKEQYEKIIRDLAQSLKDIDIRYARYRTTLGGRQDYRFTQYTRQAAQGSQNSKHNPRQNNKKNNKKNKKNKKW